MTNVLKKYLQDITELRKNIKNLEVERVSRKELKFRTEVMAQKWFDELYPKLSGEHGFTEEVLDKYSHAAESLIMLSSGNNRRTSYVQKLNIIVKPFRSELILPLQTSSRSKGSIALLHTLLAGLQDRNENEYLKEAINCAQRGYFRAATILGWCAAIDRIHRKIMKLGITQFNVMSVRMAGQQKGRFKRFNSPQNISSLGELREVFDTIVLWVIEGLGLIDPNQQTRLKSCFDMRCQSAHPGETTITEYNLLSFFSDLDTIVFRNTVFEL